MGFGFCDNFISLFFIFLRIVLAMASSGAMVATYSGMAQQKREVNRE